MSFTCHISAKRIALLIMKHWFSLWSHAHIKLKVNEVFEISSFISIDVWAGKVSEINGKTRFSISILLSYASNGYSIQWFDAKKGETADLIWKNQITCLVYVYCTNVLICIFAYFSVCRMENLPTFAYFTQHWRSIRF